MGKEYTIKVDENVWKRLFRLTSFKQLKTMNVESFKSIIIDLLEFEDQLEYYRELD
jgi:hypothetical protein